MQSKLKKTNFAESLTYLQELCKKKIPKEKNILRRNAKIFIDFFFLEVIEFLLRERGKNIDRKWIDNMTHFQGKLQYFSIR